MIEMDLYLERNVELFFESMKSSRNALFSSIVISGSPTC